MSRSTQSLPSMKKSTSSKVSFNELATETVVVEPLHCNLNASWYSSDELRTFRKTQRSKSDSASSKDYVRSLLSIQKLHQDMGIQDPKGLRQMSRAYSKGSIKKAIERAQEILSEDE